MNVAGIHALGASLELLLGIGIPDIMTRVLELTDYLEEHAAQAGLEVFRSSRREEQSGIVALTVPGADLGALVHRCRREGIALSVRSGRLRISPHCYNNIEEIDRLVLALTRPAAP